MPGVNGHITEIFPSLQGEGIYVGEPQIFIRLAVCPWRCVYCDTPGSLTRAGSRELSVEDVLDDVHHILEKSEFSTMTEAEKPSLSPAMDRRDVPAVSAQRTGTRKWVEGAGLKTISLTGGEPLVQPEFLSALLPALRRLDRRTYLETGGTHPEALKKLIGEIDVVAMDIKLPSAIRREFWKEHEEFLRVGGNKAFVKIVLTGETTDDEISKALGLVASVSPKIPLVLQPVTGISALEDRLQNKKDTRRVGPPPSERVEKWHRSAKEKLSDVRVSVQMHPIWGVP